MSSIAPDPEAALAPLSFADLDALAVDKLHGVLPKKRSALKAMGIDSVLDLLLHYPRRYVDRTQRSSIAGLVAGAAVTIDAEVVSVKQRRLRGNRTMVDVVLGDDSGTLRVSFFNQPWRARQLHAGRLVVAFGTPERFRGSLQMTNPVIDLVGDQTGRIIAIYPQSDKAGITSLEIGQWVAEALRRTSGRGIGDPIPEERRRQLGLCSRNEAFISIHMPEHLGHVRQARQRLIFDELLRMQLLLVDRKRRFLADTTGVRHRAASGVVERFHSRIPFDLTAAQRRVMAEIDVDMASPMPMHRLLQGDVGSGKTVVALNAMLRAVDSGFQAAMMAPTEVLAEQHAEGVLELSEGLEVSDDRTLSGLRPLVVEYFSSKHTPKAREAKRDRLARGEIDIAVGTQALIQDGVGFERLGVAVVDEQHRFGVNQRAALRMPNADGSTPDLLVMTATPIPRSAAMTVYGDLDVSVLDELPPGRTPVRTVAVHTEQAVADMWVDVRRQLDAGHQAYVVCPLIDASETVAVASVQQVYDDLRTGEFVDYPVALVHGRMKAQEKAQVMGAFRSGDTAVLVSTTVIEVGVDVPNATVMVVIDADRFGIAQLHQLRGRVGRGAAESFCYLVATDPGDNGQARVDALVATNDGFELAEVDLRLRGEGTVFGDRQTGRSDLRLASLPRDIDQIQPARAEAEAILDRWGSLAETPQWSEELETMFRDEDSDFLMKG